MNNLRRTNDLGEIAYFLKDSIPKATNIMLWQNIKGVRHIWHGRILFLDQEKNKVILVFNENKEKVDVKKKSTLYVKGEFESVLFKAEIKGVGDHYVQIEIPQFAYLYEKRKFERFKFAGDTNSVLFTRSNDTYTTRSRFTGNVIDISRQGITLIIQPNMAQNWSPQDSLNIYRISDKKLNTPITAKIIYIKPIRTLANNRMSLQYRFGLQFKSEMNRIEISAIAKTNAIKIA